MSLEMLPGSRDAGNRLIYRSADAVSHPSRAKALAALEICDVRHHMVASAGGLP
jgi:hypothetical protein